MKISRIYLEKLRNEAHYQFFFAFIALVSKYLFIKEKALELFELLQQLFTREDEVVDYIRKSDYTAKIADADRRLDRVIIGFGEIVEGACHHFNPQTVDAAQSLKNLLKTYGNIIKKNYDEELAAVTNLLQDLDGTYREKVDAVDGLPGWVQEIRAANDALATLLELRNTEKAAKPQERMAGVRREIDVVYRNLIARIEALALVEGEANYVAFVNELNALVERFNRIRPHKTEKKDTAGENNEPS
jgi:hypothetical protein